MKKYMIFLLFLVLMCTTAFAKENPEDIWEGMTYADVLEAWGAPTEKIVKEAKREDLWIYKESEVRFVEGKLVSTNKRKFLAMKEKSIQDSEMEYAEENENEVESAQVEDILTEIMTGSTSKVDDKKGRVGARRRRK